MDLTDRAPRVWLRGFGYYAIWFVIWGGLFSSLQPVTAEQMEDIGFWSVKVQQVLVALLFGLLCTVAFTFLHNGVNQARKRWLSWLLGVGTWMIMSLMLPYTVERFG